MAVPTRLYEASDYRRRMLQVPEAGARGHDSDYLAAAHFLGGAMAADGFRLFRNGGLPLLERREGPVRLEIVLPLRARHSDSPVQVSAKVHLSHDGLPEIRERYWPSIANAPAHLASGNIGELDLPPHWAIWDVSNGDSLPDFTLWVRALVLPWFERFAEPPQMLEQLWREDVPLLPREQALEWVLAEFGRREARGYYEHLDRLGLLPNAGQTRRRIDRIVLSYRLV